MKTIMVLLSVCILNICNAQKFEKILDKKIKWEHGDDTLFIPFGKWKFIKIGDRIFQKKEIIEEVKQDPILSYPKVYLDSLMPDITPKLYPLNNTLIWR